MNHRLIVCTILLLLGKVICAQQFKTGDHVDGKCISGNCDNGVGKYMFIDSTIYSGKFVNGQLDGEAIVTYSDGSFFKGTFVKGSRIKGKFVWSDGAVYIGEMNDTVMEGEGKFIDYYEIYAGSFKNGEYDGYGKLIFKSKESKYLSYEGGFADGTFSGLGKLMYRNRDKYEGEFMDGKKHGLGTMQYSNGKTTKQEWDKGKMKSEVE